MRTSAVPYTADWFAISLRWLALIGILVSLGLWGGLSIATAWPLLLLAFWNLTQALLAGLNLRLPGHRWVNMAVDMLFSALFVWTQGGLSGPAAWGGLLPALTGAVYFDLWGSLAAGLLAAVTLVGLDRLSADGGSPLPAILMGLLLLGLSAGIGFAGRGFTRELHRLREQRMEGELRQMRSENERLRAIYELTSTLTGTLSYKRVLDSALDLGVTALNPEQDHTPDARLVSAVLLFKGQDLVIGSARRFTPADLRTRLTGSEGLLAKVINDGEPVLSHNIGYDPELGRIVALRTCTSSYCFPLRSGFSVYGAILFAHPDPDYFTPDRREVLAIIGRQAIIAIQNARLYQDLVEEKERMIEVQEEARKKLARDLHDGPTQSISAMAMRLNIIRRMLERDPKAANDELVRIEELALRTTKEIRHMLFTLRPLVLEAQGLTAALQAMADKMKETYGQNVIIQVDDGVVKQMELGKLGVVFYIAEEAVNNARKHAKASSIWVRLKQLEAGLVLLEVQDDGVGFDVEAVMATYDKRGSLGMINLHERSELINGLLHIESAPGKGTRVQIFIPLTEEAADRLHHGH